MSLSMYQASVPLFTQTLACLSAILDKAAAYAEAKKIDPSVLVNARLFPDMFPMSRQVQIACDFAKGATARLAGAEVPSYADTEASFAELKQRIAKTVSFISQFKAEQIDGSEERDISLKIGGQDMAFKGQQYLIHFVMPNFFFHAATAYGILRHSGVELGKRDFMMPPGA
jgi:hypothetical protein